MYCFEDQVRTRYLWNDIKSSFVPMSVNKLSYFKEKIFVAVDIKTKFRKEIMTIEEIQWIILFRVNGQI